MMTSVDWLLALVLGFAFLKGWRSGLFRQLASIGGLVGGFILARMLYGVVGDILAPHLGTSQTIAGSIAFLLIWVGVPITAAFVAHVLTQTAEYIFLGELNRLAGGIMGVLKYCLFLSFFLHIVTSFHWIDREKQEHSVLCQPIASTGNFLFHCMRVTWHEYQKKSDSPLHRSAAKEDLQPVSQGFNNP